MARYRGPVCRLCRREGKKLFLKGTRCDTDKCSMERRSKPTGGRSRTFRKRRSGYAIHMREKQKAKSIYGMLEHEFKHYFEIAARKKGVTGEILLQFLERRLDNVVYRAGFTPSRRAARHLVTHGHFIVNNHKVNVPSYLVKRNDLISLKESSQNLLEITQSIKADRGTPNWLEFDKTNFKVTVKDIPKREDAPTDIQEGLIVELYSK